ncbi:hypothetical protein Tco_1335872 [Tanacetum coccineum]
MVDQLAPPEFISQLWGMDYDQLFAEFNVGVARQACFSAEVRLRFEHNYRERKKFERKCQRQTDLLEEKGDEIASLKERLSLKEAKAAEVICLRGLVTTIESAETARVNELIGLKERYLALEEEKNVLEKKVAVLESTNATKVIELTPLTTQTAKLTQDFSKLGLSCDELSVKASPLEAERDRLIDQVSLLEGTCSGLRDEVAGFDVELMGMALHLDEELYPRFLATIAGQMCIINHGFRLVVMKRLQPPEYLAALGKSIGCVIDKGMQNGLEAGIDHGRAKRSLADVAAYDPFTEANYVSNVHALRGLDFPLLSQLESQKDASIVDIMSLLNLEGSAAETPETSQLQPSIKGEVALHHLSLSDVVVPLIEPLSARNLVGEASTSGVPAAVAVTSALSTNFAQTGSVPHIPVSAHDAEPHVEVPSSAAIVFEKEELETMPERPKTS